MNTSVLIVLFSTDGNSYRFYEPVQFVFRKEKYTPFTELSLTVQDKEGIVPALCTFNRIVLAVSGFGLHDGLIDNADFRIEKGVSVISVRSRGFTSLLLNNEMVPGLHYTMSINKLMQEYYTFPFPVKWKNDSTACNYIYVKPHRSMWDSVVNMAFKLYDCYPYIRYTNEINLEPHEDPKDRSFSRSEYIAAGWTTSAKSLLSDLHMQDIEGNYETYNLNSPQAEDMYIVRHKQVAFDRQYLDEPDRSMELTFALAAKGWRKRYVTIAGYENLDLYDFAAAEGVFDSARICAVTVTGNAAGVRTTYTVYEDNLTK